MRPTKARSHLKPAWLPRLPAPGPASGFAAARRRRHRRRESSRRYGRSDPVSHMAAQHRRHRNATLALVPPPAERSAATDPRTEKGPERGQERMGGTLPASGRCPVRLRRQSVATPRLDGWNKADREHEPNVKSGRLSLSHALRPVRPRARVSRRKGDRPRADQTTRASGRLNRCHRARISCATLDNVPICHADSFSRLGGPSARRLGTI